MIEVYTNDSTHCSACWDKLVAFDEDTTDVVSCSAFVQLGQSASHVNSVYDYCTLCTNSMLKAKVTQPADPDMP
eukprot:CAMPEP_0205830708 /NCGR_PEP_ID=MMETSP0206-20130828/41969_1 /ASSEMBLY_ACC=CAM_ASM_000279 /TAXON_ID=36767 /ORGANISM="Euplotes focardii, Strain TN1" /LENGTH=73 /DNA_ID=CAMNT_0053134643 /DNA_START=184 /DNA_END=401 /DNA_ORIENTATION=-